MPEARRPRQSSLGARRGPPKAHIPYRGDPLEVTRKTGIRISHNPNSDGFEPYEAFAQQAEKITPFQVKGKRKSRRDASQEPEQEEEEEGDSDMDIDSPIHYIANSRQPTSPISRVGSMSRPVARNPANQFDALPSPHARSPNKSRNGRASARPSRLSQRLMGSDDSPVSANTRRTSGYEDMSLDSGFQNDLSPQHRSFTELDQDGMDDDDEPDDIAAEPPVPSPSRKKGKKSTVERDVSPEDSPPRTQTPDVEEDEIQQKLTEVDEEPAVDEDEQEEEEEEEEEEPVPSKKVKLDKGKEKAKPKGQAKKKENHREGVRRSQRKPIKPLEWWRNEKYVYERPAAGGILVPHIKEIIRIPEEPKEPLGKHQPKRKRGRSKTVVPALSENPEEGWDDHTSPVSVVLDWKTKDPVDKRITCLAKNVKPQPAANSEWFFQRIFGDDSFIAAGQLVIPINSRKPSKTTKDNTYIFYIIEGAINLKVHEQSMILCTGAMFMIPRGNTYFIENIGDRDAKLFFTQARKEEIAEGAAEGGTTSRTRSSSVAGPSKPPSKPLSKTAAKRANTIGV